MSGSPNIEVSKKEIYKISNCYTQVMQEVLDKPGTKELTEIKIDVLLAKRSNVQDLISGHYQVTSKQPGEWTWKQGNQITA